MSNTASNISEISISNPPAKKWPEQSKIANISPKKPIKKKAKIELSPEAKKIAEAQDRAMIEEFMRLRQVTKCAPQWAPGSVVSNLFGSDS
jgi:hypothetical protein